MIKLKPCPFCGGKARIIENNIETYSVMCEKCLVETEKYFNKDVAANAWNRRVNND